MNSCSVKEKIKKHITVAQRDIDSAKLWLEKLEDVIASNPYSTKKEVNKLKPILLSIESPGRVKLSSAIHCEKATQIKLSTMASGAIIEIRTHKTVT